MIFVDTNVFMYAVGQSHPLRDDARRFFETSSRDGSRLATSTEVLQELMHAYVPVGRVKTLDAALTLTESALVAIWPIEHEDVRFARTLLDRFPGLSARDLLHLACCKRNDAKEVHSYDRALAAAFRI